MSPSHLIFRVSGNKKKDKTEYVFSSVRKHGMLCFATMVASKCIIVLESSSDALGWDSWRFLSNTYTSYIFVKMLYFTMTQFTPIAARRHVEQFG